MVVLKFFSSFAQFCDSFAAHFTVLLLFFPQVSFIIFHLAATATAAASHNSVSLHTTFVFIVTSFGIAKWRISMFNTSCRFQLVLSFKSNKTARITHVTNICFLRTSYPQTLAIAFSLLVFRDSFCFSPLSLTHTAFGTSPDSFLQRSKSSTIVPFRQIWFQLKFQPNTLLV